MPRRDTYVVVNQRTGERKEKTQIPYQLEGKGYTMQGHSTEVPLYALGLTGAEWAVIDWLKEHGGSCEAVRVDKELVAEDIHATPATVKTALSRLVKLGLALRTAPRSSTYQLNPRRFWEGSAGHQARTIKRADPPRVRPDAKAGRLAESTAGKKDRESSATVRPLRSGKGRAG